MHLRRVVCVNIEAGREKKRRVEQPERKKKTPTTIEREKERERRVAISSFAPVPWCRLIKGTFSLEKKCSKIFPKNGKRPLFRV